MGKSKKRDNSNGLQERTARLRNGLEMEPVRVRAELSKNDLEDILFLIVKSPLQHAILDVKINYSEKLICFTLVTHSISDNLFEISIFELSTLIFFICI